MINHTNNSLMKIATRDLKQTPKTKETNKEEVKEVAEVEEVITKIPIGSKTPNKKEVVLINLSNTRIISNRDLMEIALRKIINIMQLMILITRTLNIEEVESPIEVEVVVKAKEVVEVDTTIEIPLKIKMRPLIHLSSSKMTRAATIEEEAVVLEAAEVEASSITIKKVKVIMIKLNLMKVKTMSLILLNHQEEVAVDVVAEVEPEVEVATDKIMAIMTLRAHKIKYLLIPKMKPTAV